uniref:Pectinesterase inhibitor domain-containing protein n=1 Tax=Kalanchoe fedtschenkoi TaxID=63787 RepID=A0A7N1A0I1_KALFE
MESHLMLGFPCLVVVLLAVSSCAQLSVAVDDVVISPSPAPGEADADFIRASCSSATLYPELCFATLARYADSIGNDRGLLARAAIFVSLSRAKHVAAYVSREAKSGSDDSQAVSALRDCVSSFGDAMEQMRGSLKQMKEIETAGRTSGGQSVRFWASNVQTWMSAALTNQDTCTDGFEEVDEGPLKAEVGRRVGLAKKLTSNALALINTYVNDELSP